jgi:ribosomal protein S18 acetylase RimI-like enzyme
MPEVRKATTADIDAMATALADAFDGDPVYEFLFPHRKAYGAFFAHELKSIALPHDETWTTVDGVRGGALWAPPGQWRQPLWDLARSAPTYARMLGRRLPRAWRFLAGMEAAHPPGNHYYLAVLGVEKASQGRGVASALLTPVLERCDRDGIGAYLESSKYANIAFYNRHGFEVTRELQLPGGAPPIWLMWREPRPPEA